MRPLWIPVLLFPFALSAQSLLTDPSQIAIAAAAFDPQPDETSFPCKIELVQAYDSTFAVEAKYSLKVRSHDSSPRAYHRWVTAARVMPGQPSGGAKFLIGFSERYGINLDSGRYSLDGSFWLGSGDYVIDWRVSDGNGRICRQRSVLTASGTGDLTLGRGAVADMSMEALALLDPRAPHPGLSRLTVLLDAAPWLSDPKRLPGKLPDLDQRRLLDGLAAILREIPAESIRLICFSLDQQREVFRDDDFHFGSLGRLKKSLSRLDFGTVPYNVVTHPRGHLDLLARLINDEIRANPSADAVIFFGPQERFKDRIPAHALEERRGKPDFFYLRSQQRPDSTFWNGSVSKAVQAAQGKTIDYANSEDLIKSVVRIRRALLPPPESRSSRP